MARRVYLDYAAGAPVRRPAKRAFLRALSDYGNPSSPHEEGRRARTILQSARETVARLSGVQASRVVFTSGATEANDIAIRGVVAKYLEGSNRKSVEVLFHPGAHASLAKTVQSLGGEMVKTIPIPTHAGTVDIERLKSCITENTALVSVEAISSVTGMRFKTKDIRRALDAFHESKGKKIPLHIDASQLPLVESIEHTRLGADLLTIDAQKIGGVRGAGALIVGRGVSLAASRYGGGQEQGLRPGTEAPALAAALAAALLEAEKQRNSFTVRARTLREYLVKEIIGNIPNVVVLGGKDAAPHILCFALPGRDTDYLVALLDEKGFAVSTKSACESDAPHAAVMAYLETNDEQCASSTLRVSFGWETTGADVKRFLAALTDAARFLDQEAL